MKICLYCRIAKPPVDFYQRGKGLSSRCKGCQKQQAREWAKTHPDARHRIMQDWKGRTDIPKHNRKIWVKRAYGLTLEEIDSVFMRQNGYCSICQNVLGRYHIDHNHATGLVRGLLCRNCNLGLGFFQDSALLLQNALRYLV